MKSRSFWLLLRRHENDLLRCASKRSVPTTYRFTRALVLVAIAAVLVAGVLIGRGFVQHTTDPCKGTLVEVPLGDLGDLSNAEHVVEADVNLAIRAESVARKGESTTQFEKVRVVWNRPDTSCSCAEINLPWDRSRDGIGSPEFLELRRDRETGAFVLGHYAGKTIVAFRKTEKNGVVLRAARILEPNNVGSLVFLASLGALALAMKGILRARPYATRLRSWQSGTLRPDGLVESPNGASLGRIGPRVYITGSDVIVDPAAFEGRDVYREMPMLARKDIAAGTHEHWTAGTMRRLRDARTLAILATATTGLAVAAHFFSV